MCVGKTPCNNILNIKSHSSIDAFYNKANLPLSNWDFNTIWQENANVLPTLRNLPPSTWDFSDTDENPAVWVMPTVANGFPAGFNGEDPVHAWCKPMVLNPPLTFSDGTQITEYCGFK